MERETGLEPATICLEGRCATIALLPHRGRGDRIRTYDPRVPNAVRYQLRYTPTVAAVYPMTPPFVKECIRKCLPSRKHNINDVLKQYG